MRPLYCDVCHRLIKVGDKKFLLSMTPDVEEKEDSHTIQSSEQATNIMARYVKSSYYSTKFVICSNCRNIISGLFKKELQEVIKLQNEFNHILSLPLKEEGEQSMKQNKLNGVYFVGKAGAGKTYATKYLLQKLENALQSKFAYPVYNIAYDYFSMKEKNRKLLQIIGTDCGRDLIDENIWLRRFKEDLKIVREVNRKLNDKEVIFISDDTRFPNEHELLKNLGWLGIYLNVPEDMRIKRLCDRDGDAQINTLQHKSETLIDTFKEELVQVDSSGSLEDTYKNIDKVIKTYLEK